MLLETMISDSEFERTQNAEDTHSVRTRIQSVISRDMMPLRRGVVKMRTGCSCGSGSVSVSSRIICLHIYLHMRASYARNGRAIVSPPLSQMGPIY